MTDETHLVTDVEVLSVRHQGPAIAGIWLAIGNSPFPMAGWTDFVVVVLSWWAAALVRLLRNQSQRERVYFMDGPYSVELSKSQSERLHFRMFAGAGGGREVAAAEVELNGFVNEVVHQSRRILDECKLRDWWSHDAETLESHLNVLMREFNFGV
jgi:hypothetical protein